MGRIWLERKENEEENGRTTGSVISPKGLPIYANILLASGGIYNLQVASFPKKTQQFHSCEERAMQHSHLCPPQHEW